MIEEFLILIENEKLIAIDESGRKGKKAMEKKNRKRCKRKTLDNLGGRQNIFSIATCQMPDDNFFQKRCF